eukprot:SAG31_NODE_9704_length_1240_cov_0.892200_1_plen_61_part_10
MAHSNVATFCASTCTACQSIGYLWGRTSCLERNTVFAARVVCIPYMSIAIVLVLCLAGAVV